MIDPKRNEVLVCLDHASGDNPRIGRVVGADQPQTNIGCAGQRLQQRNGSGNVERAHQAQRQRMPRRRPPEQIPCGLRVIDDAACDRIELLRRRCRHDAFLVPDEQRCTEFRFKIGDGQRDRGLRDKATPRRACQVALLEHRGEISKLPNIHRPVL
jgi:hypothetical protein